MSGVSKSLSLLLFGLCFCSLRKSIRLHLIISKIAPKCCWFNLPWLVCSPSPQLALFNLKAFLWFCVKITEHCSNFCIFLFDCKCWFWLFDCSFWCQTLMGLWFQAWRLKKKKTSLMIQKLKHQNLLLLRSSDWIFFFFSFFNDYQNLSLSLSLSLSLILYM